MKRILFITGTIDEVEDQGSGGVARIFSLIASKIAEDQRFEVSVMSLYKGIRATHFEFNKKIDICHLQTRLVHRSYFSVLRKSVFWIIVSIRLFAYVRHLIATSEDKVTLVSVPPYISLFLIVLKLFLNFRLIVWELASFRVYSPILTAIRRWLYRYADYVVVTSRQDFDYLSSSNVKCELIFNSIAFEATGSETGTRLTPTLNERPVLLAAGRLVRQKGFDRLVEVIDILVNRLSQRNFNLLIVGSGPDKDLIREAIIEKGLLPFIELIPFTPNISNFYGRADIFVLTSRFEGLPMVLLETQAFGVPAVAFDCLTGPREVIDDGQNGYLIVDGDSEGFAKALAFLISRPDERQRLSIGALAAVKRFDLESATVRWFRIIS